jgi:hypothetical protein
LRGRHGGPAFNQGGTRCLLPVSWRSRRCEGARQGGPACSGDQVHPARRQTGRGRKGCHIGSKEGQPEYRDGGRAGRAAAIGPARAKAIIEARGKAKFKSWDDFVARNVVPGNAESAVKNLVSF